MMMMMMMQLVELLFLLLLLLNQVKYVCHDFSICCIWILEPIYLSISNFLYLFVLDFVFLVSLMMGGVLGLVIGKITFSIYPDPLEKLAIRLKVASARAAANREASAMEAELARARAEREASARDASASIYNTSEACILFCSF
jgi:hypothetical protein